MADKDAPWPTDIAYDRAARMLRIAFDDGVTAALPAELLRVNSPSAEVRGHGGGPGVLVAGKAAVAIERIEPVGAYAIRLVFSDGHDSGLYSWRLLRTLHDDQDSLWRTYLDQLAAAGMSRESAA